MPDIKTTEFIVNLDFGCRWRHHHASFKNQVIGFVTQLEIFFNGKWYPVVRYDTAHGYAHRDIIHYSGKADKSPFLFTDYADALNFAQSDIKLNWKKYREKFFKEVPDNE